MTDRPWPDPPELASAAPLFRLGYRQAQDDAVAEIGRLRAEIGRLRSSAAEACRVTGTGGR